MKKTLLKTMRHYNATQWRLKTERPGCHFKRRVNLFTVRFAYDDFYQIVIHQ